MTKYKELPVAAIIVAIFTCPAYALTAQQIADSVVGEMDNVNDLTTTYDVDFDDVDWEDETGGTITWKRTNTAEWKRLVVQGSPVDRVHIADGSGAWNLIDADDPPPIAYNYAEAATGIWAQLDNQLAMGMWYMEEILDYGAWTPTSPTTETVNSIACYKILRGNYKVWVDVATAKKVVRAERYVSGTIKWRVDFSNFSTVESTVDLPGTMVLEEFVSGVSDWIATYTFTNININESIADSVFAINGP